LARSAANVLVVVSAGFWSFRGVDRKKRRVVADASFARQGAGCRCQFRLLVLILSPSASGLVMDLIYLLRRALAVVICRSCARLTWFYLVIGGFFLRRADTISMVSAQWQDRVLPPSTLKSNGQ
jgi:hypothetical protein